MVEVYVGWQLFGDEKVDVKCWWCYQSNPPRDAEDAESAVSC